jgi:aryl-alcohol dehydrogenase-like predicted oxidoreductase
LKLALGTAQFGLDYGVSNTSGQVAADEVRRILQKAAEFGISVLDTAAGYGNAEAVLGQCLPEGASFSIVTKIQPLKAVCVDDTGLRQVAANFEASLSRLGRNSVHGLLVHHSGDLLLPGGERLYAMLRQWQADGRVSKIGVSVYGRAEIDALFDRYVFDLVQLPLNVFDQRLVLDGTLKVLHGAGVEIHARSVFLQGAVLLEPSDLPAHLRELKPYLDEFQGIARDRKMSPLAAALGFVKNIPEIAVALIGVLSARQLQECIDAYNLAEPTSFSHCSVASESLVDPRCWPN